jgi:hypothetical protein
VLDALLGPTDDSSLEARSILADSLAELGRLQEAYEIQADELGRCSARHGDDHPATLASVNNMGAILYRLGRYTDAEALQVTTSLGAVASWGQTTTRR